MRIVMLTDDVAIDRRILQEAESLRGLGHEIILLAGAHPDRPTYERIHGVKVERLTPALDGRREHITLRLGQVAEELIDTGSTVTERWVARGTGVAFGVLQAVVVFCYGAVRKGLDTFKRVPGLSQSATNLLRRADHAHDSARRVLGSSQPAAVRASVAAVGRGWWLLGYINDHAMPLMVKLVRRTRRIPVRDAIIADRAAYYRPDVVHAHDLPQLRGGYEAARRLAVPLVYDAHELYPEIGTLTERQQRRLSRLERRLIPRCHVAITVNPYIAREMARRYHIAEPTVILNAINPLPAAPYADQLRTALDLPLDARILLFQGWMSPTRGLDRLIDALALTAPHIHLVLLGYGDMVPELSAHAQSRGASDRVHFHDAVPQDVLLEWTMSADAGVIPYPAVDLNHRLCSPNKLFEFIQSGLPIVGNDLPFLRDVIAGEGIGLVAPIENAVSFAAAIDELLAPSGKKLHECRSRIGEVAPRYDWNTQAAVLTDLYAALPHPVAGAAR